MALQLGRALGRGARRSASVSGLVVLVLSVLYQIAFLGAVNTAVVNLLPDGVRPTDAGAVGFSLPISTEMAGVLAVASLLFGTGVFVVAARLLARDPTTLGSLPTDAFTRRIGRALLSALVVNLVLAVAIPLGLALFVIPGLFLAVSFQFAVFAIAVEDAGPVGALKRSWALASGDRWRLLVLVLLLAVVGGVSGAVGSLFSLADPLVGQLLSLALTSVVLVLMYGILADAFLQLREEPVFGTGGGSPGTADVGAL
jgi:hypothetical protein